MMPEQTPVLETQPRFTSPRAQERYERHLAKQAIRAERRAARALRPRQDWTFKVQIGEKTYTFTWSWGEAEFQAQVTDETKVDRAGPEKGMDALAGDQ